LHAYSGRNEILHANPLYFPVDIIMETNHCVFHIFLCISLILTHWDTSSACHKRKCEQQSGSTEGRNQWFTVKSL